MAMETPARIAVLGAGPIGLEASLYGRYLGYQVDLYDRGLVGANVLRWGHVRMFSPFGENRSPLGIAALRAQDDAWDAPPDDSLLTGQQYVQQYLLPLARSDLIVDGLCEQTEVLAVGREDLLKGELAGDESRGEGAFRLLLSALDPDGHRRQRYATADVVIDATGTFGHPNYLGRGGLPALGELAAAAHLEYGLPDVLGADRDRYARRNILLIGDGDSAATNLVALAELAAQSRDTWITWVTRTADDRQPAQPIALVEGDPLPARQRLARRANELAASDANHVTHYPGTSVEALTWHADLDRFSVQLAGKHAGELEFDRVIANVGYRGDARLSSELQVGTQPVSGAAAEGSHLLLPEADFYVLGAKSSGRGGRFLIRDGLDQIRRLFTIVGDRAELDLYANVMLG